MLCLLTARNLKPDAWEPFRRAWDPGDERPPNLVRVIHARSVRDEDEVVSFGLFDCTVEEFRAWRAEHEDDELKRQDAMAPFIRNVSTDGMYEVIEDLS